MEIVCKFSRMTRETKSITNSNEKLYNFVKNDCVTIHFESVKPLVRL